MLRILLLLLLLRDDGASFNFFFFVITLHSDGCICEVFKMHFSPHKMGGGGAKLSKSTTHTRGKMVFAFFLAYAFCF